ncbi:hypothetical protein TNCV_3516251 [Trichonephila clavipes]|nr:hypothetical protein TNCV_3516251 [Trichonephila clavipes]
MKRSLKNAVKTSIRPHDVWYVLPSCCNQDPVDIPVTGWSTVSGIHICHFRFTMDALPDCSPSVADPLSWNRYTKRVIEDASGAISPGYF